MKRLPQIILNVLPTPTSKAYLLDLEYLTTWKYLRMELFPFFPATYPEKLSE